MSTPRLLVSVRDAAEAEAALAGGAGLIDVKEPARGPLGRADAAVIAAIVRAVGGRVPVSAALGELRECPLVTAGEELPAGVGYVKWGLSGLLRARWGRHLVSTHQFLPHARPVAVAYADWVRADAPRPADVAAYAGRFGFVKAFLIDTFIKDGSTLLDWLTTNEVAALVRICRDADAAVTVALAGSLGPAEIERLRGVEPDWFAVRGAACAGGRDGRIEEARVRDLVALIQGMASA
jgi:(5-formylfuran-3-yl)methyl phosphate synthase